MGYGISSSAEVTHLADGTPVQTVWDEIREVTRLHNAERQAIEQLLSYRTTARAVRVAQTIADAEFEEASEYGEPKGIRGATYLTLGARFKWFDLGARFTWQFLAEADADEVRAVTDGALQADSRLTFRGVMGAILDNAVTTLPTGETVYPLWAGAVGDLPMPYLGTTFADQHQHYITSGSATLDAGDVEALMDKVLEHGYATGPGSTLLVFAPRAEAKVIQGFRAGAGTPAASYDFIPSTSAPAFRSAEVIIGSRPDGDFNGLKVVGSYGPALVIEEALMPSGYLAAVATSGSNSALNPVSFREHVTQSLRGFRQVKGPQPDYPLTESYWSRGFGSGIRHRGAAAALQVTASGTYTPPAAYVGHP